MTYPTTPFQPSLREKLLRPAFGLAAAFATAATLGLAVVTPATLAPAGADADVYASARPQAGPPTEVAILPRTIEVVARRTKAAQAPSPYLPATFRPRG